MYLYFKCRIDFRDSMFGIKFSRLCIIDIPKIGQFRLRKGMDTLSSGFLFSVIDMPTFRTFNKSSAPCLRISAKERESGIKKFSVAFKTTLSIPKCLGVPQFSQLIFLILRLRTPCFFSRPFPRNGNRYLIPVSSVINKHSFSNVPDNSKFTDNSPVCTFSGKSFLKFLIIVTVQFRFNPYPRHFCREYKISFRPIHLKSLQIYRHSLKKHIPSPLFNFCTPATVIFDLEETCFTVPTHSPSRPRRIREVDNES